MIIFLAIAPHLYTHKDVVDADPNIPVAIRSYEWLLGQDPLPKGHYIFTDRERMTTWELRVLGGLFDYINNAGPAYAATNAPYRMQDRTGLLRLLHAKGINDFNVYPVTERRSPARYPVFLRRAFDHMRPLSELLHNEEQLIHALQHQRNDRKEPDEGLLITEYCAEPVAGTLFRKLSSYKVGDEIFFYHTVHENTWMVKYGEQNSANDALYTEEREMIEGNAFRDELDEIFATAGIDYGRADFGLVNGKPQVYEINTNPSIKRPTGDHPNPIRASNLYLAWQKYLDALRKLDRTDPRGPSAPRFERPDLRHGEHFSVIIRQ